MAFPLAASQRASCPERPACLESLQAERLDVPCLGLCLEDELHLEERMHELEEARHRMGTCPGERRGSRLASRREQLRVQLQRPCPLLLQLRPWQQPRRLPWQPWQRRRPCPWPWPCLQHLGPWPCPQAYRLAERAWGPDPKPLGGPDSGLRNSQELGQCRRSFRFRRCHLAHLRTAPRRQTCRAI